MNYKILSLIGLFFLAGCSSSDKQDTIWDGKSNAAKTATRDGKQYRDGRFYQSKELVERYFVGPVNVKDFQTQINAIQKYSPRLYQKYRHTYQAVNNWLVSNQKETDLTKRGLSVYQLAGEDNYGNVHMTGYYTPVFKAKYQADKQYRYPLYGMPTKRKGGKLPSRAQIHAGALKGQGLELAYTRSLFDNFTLGVQGSGYIDYGDGLPLVFFSYKGKNGHGYKSIGRILIERGEISKDEISMKKIKEWLEKRDEKTGIALLNENPSFVFFYPKVNEFVRGAAGVPLVAKASVATDKNLIPTGSVLLVEMPILNKKGVFTGRHELRLMIALDVGGAIKRQRIDLYQGIGDDAGNDAGHYNHYGRVWLLSTP